MKSLLLVGLAAFVMFGAAVFHIFSRDIDDAKQQVTGRSNIIETSLGLLEYAQRGDGPPFLMIHGTGGGFDQGLTFTEALTGFTVIAPSRFGYLRSSFPENPSSARQADAFAELLDLLNIDRLPVAGGSAGALSAVQFALRYPERTSALILVVPAANVRGRDPVEMSQTTEWLVQRLSGSDFLFWSATKIARDRMIGTLLATDPALIDRASRPEQDRVNRILEEILPVSQRSRGMLNDAKLAGNPARVDFTKLSVPTLVISVEDDRFGTAQTAREIASDVPNAKLVIYPKGGHVWVGNDAQLWREVAGFINAQQSPDRMTTQLRQK